MTGIMVLQGREVSGADLGLIRDLLAEQPAWGRTRLSEALCRRWDWRHAQGRATEMAARTWLLTLERAGHIRLPPRRGPSSNGSSESSRADRGAGDRSDPVCAARPAPADGDRRRAALERPAPIERPARRRSRPRASPHGGRAPALHPGRPTGVVRMLTRQDAHALYRAGEDTVVRVLLEMNARMQALERQVQDLTARLNASEQRVRQLEEQVAKDSHNSSKPPSSDGLAKPKPKRLRPPSARPTGGQPGHPGRTLRMVEQPDRTGAPRGRALRGLRSLPGQSGPGPCRAPAGLRSARADPGGHRAPGRRHHLRLWLRQPRRVSARGCGPRAVRPARQERGRLGFMAGLS